jgi:hypothetical protein
MLRRVPPVIRARDALGRLGPTIHARRRRIIARLAGVPHWLRRWPAAVRARAYGNDRVARFDAIWHGGAVTAIGTIVLTGAAMWFFEDHLDDIPSSVVGEDWARFARFVEGFDFGARMGFLERTLVFAIPTTFGFGILTAALNALTPYGSPGLLLRLRGWDRTWMGVPLLGYFVGRRSPLLTLVLPGIATTAAVLTLAAFGQWHRLVDPWGPPSPHVASLAVVLLLAALQYGAVLYLLFWLAWMRSPMAGAAHLSKQLTALLEHVERADHFTRHREPPAMGVSHVYEEQLQFQLLLEALGQLALLARRDRQLPSARAALAQIVDARRQMDALPERARLPVEWRLQQPQRVDAPAVVASTPLLDVRGTFPERDVEEVGGQDWWGPLTVNILSDLLRDGVRDRDRDTIESATQALVAVAQVRQPRPTVRTGAAVTQSALALAGALGDCAGEQVADAEFLLEQVGELLGPRPAGVDAGVWATRQELAIAEVAPALHQQLIAREPQQRAAARDALSLAAWHSRARVSVVTATVVALAATHSRRQRAVSRELHAYLAQLDSDGRAIERGLGRELLVLPFRLPVPSDVRAGDMERAVALAASYGPQWRPRARAFARACRESAGVGTCVTAITRSAEPSAVPSWLARLQAL